MSLPPPLPTFKSDATCLFCLKPIYCDHKKRFTILEEKYQTLFNQINLFMIMLIFKIVFQVLLCKKRSFIYYARR